MNSLREWLINENLEIYLPKFIEHNLLLGELSKLKPEQIPAEMGLLAGDRVKLRRAVTKLEPVTRQISREVPTNLAQTLNTVAGQAGMVSEAGAVLLQITT